MRILLLIMMICFSTMAETLYFNSGPAPVIDGTEDEVWKNVKPLTLKSYTAGHPVNMKTMVKIMYDLQNIYFFFYCRETNLVEARQQQKLTRHDAAVWENDCVEILLDTKNNSQSYYQFVVDIHNTAADFRHYDPEWKQNALAWNGIWQHATGTYDDGWTMEAAIPWNTLEGSIYDNKTVRLNLSRVRRIAPFERSVLATTPKGFHQLECFHTYTDLKITKPVLRVDIKPDVLYQGTNQIKLQVYNSGDKEINSELVMSLQTANGENIEQQRTKLKIAAKSDKILTLPCQVTGRGDYRITLSLDEFILAARNYTVKELFELGDSRPVAVTGKALTFLLRLYSKAGDKTLTATVIDANGKKWLEVNHEKQSDTFFWTLPADKLIPGDYQLKISLGQQEKSWPLLVVPKL